jgi:SUKH-3 immunity protein
MVCLTPPPEVVFSFERAGWHAGYRLADQLLMPPSHPAAQILASFGGLVVRPESKAGAECAAADISFGRLAEQDPLVAEWAALLGTELLGVAECHSGHEALFVATDGRCYGLSYIHTAFYYYGDTFSEAIIRILKGYRAKPMLLPTQSEVTLYGEVFTSTSPSLYDHDAEVACGKTSEA